MDELPRPVDAPVGARFFDHHRRDLGWAASVAKRAPSLGGLTVLDVATAEPGLVVQLLLLDKSRLVVRCDGISETAYRFAWASGYPNGSGIRIQGVLE